MLREGRARVALLVSTATVLGGITGAVPALAGGAPPEAVVTACAEPTRTTPTVVVGGEEVTCPVPDATTAEAHHKDAAPASTKEAASPPAPEPAPAAQPADAAAPADAAMPTGPAADPAPRTDAEVTSAPAADAPMPSGTTDTTTTSTEAGTTTPPEPPPPAGTTSSNTTPPPVVTEPPSTTQPEAPPVVTQPAPEAPTVVVPAEAPVDPAAIVTDAPPMAQEPTELPTAALADAPALTQEPTPAPRRAPKRTAKHAPPAHHTAATPRPEVQGTGDFPNADTDAGASPQSGADAASYAALPASWTSLTPLDLSIDTIDGFPIPPFLLPVYQAAGAQFGVPWQVLASINEIETDFGRNATVSSAGALGWMQFIRSSWEHWGTDGDGDGRRDPRNPIDAIFAAARYLRDAGAGDDLPKAVYSYNHADWYVNRVVKRAREFAGLDPTLVSALSERALQEDQHMYRARGNPFAGPGAIRPSAGQSLLLSKKQLTRIVLRSKDITVYPGGRQDIVRGKIDRRVLATLVFLARSGKKPTVSCLITGHNLMTASGNISAHSYGDAVDIAAINGTPIIGHQGTDSVTSHTLDRLVEMQGYMRPNQIISLMTVDGQDNTLSLPDHADHIHVGFPKMAKVPDDAHPDDVRSLIASLQVAEGPKPSER